MGANHRWAACVAALAGLAAAMYAVGLTMGGPAGMAVDLVWRFWEAVF